MPKLICCLILLLAQWLLSPLVVLGQPQESIQCTGSIVDIHSNPIANAMVVLVGPGGHEYFNHSVLLNDHLKTESSRTGQFEFTFKRTDQRFLRQGNFKLLAFANGCSLAVEAFTMDRLMVDLPFEITLKQSRPFELTLLDSTNKPIANATISPARISGTRIPVGCVSNLSTKTDSNGKTKLTNIAPKNLQQVYVQSEATGNQQVEFLSHGDQWIAKCLPVGNVRPETAFPDGFDKVLIQGKKFCLMTFQASTFDVKGPSTMAWQMLTFDENGKLPECLIATGQFQYFIVDDGDLDLILVNANQPTKIFSNQNEPFELPLQYVQADRTDFQILDEAGKPITGIFVDNLGAGRNFTDKSGIFTFKHSKGSKPSGQVFPYDPFGQHITPSFGFILDRLPRNDDGSHKPIRMPSGQTIHGTLTLEGKIVAGANIEFMYSEERFSLKKSTTTDKSGNFTVRGLPANSTGRLTARKGRLLTDAEANLEFEAGQTSKANVELIEQEPAMLWGRLVSDTDEPVDNAAIQISKASVFQKEGFSAEAFQAAPLFEDPITVQSNSDGVFEFPETIHTKERYQITVKHEQFYEFKSRFIDSKFCVPRNGTLYLGEFNLTAKATPSKLNLKIIDADSKTPIPNVKATFVNNRSGRTSTQSNENGIANLTLPNHGHLLALKSDASSPQFFWLESIPESKTIELSQKSPNLVATRFSTRDAAIYQRLSRDLCDELDVPKAKESTFYRQYLFFNALSRANFEKFATIMSAPTCPYEHQSTILQQSANVVFEQDPKLAVSVLKMAPLAPYQKCFFYSSFATRSESDDEQEKLFSEAVLATRSLTGVDKLSAIGRIAQDLIICNRLDDATEIIESVWQEANRFEELDARSQTIISRTFLPVLAVVDPDSSIALIKKHAREVEIAGLASQALAWLAISNDKKFQKFISKHRDKQIAAGVSEILRTQNKILIGRPSLLDLALRQGKEMTDGAAKSHLLVHAAQQIDDKVKQHKMIQMAASSYMSYNSSFFYYWSDPAKDIVHELMKFNQLDTQSIDRLLYAAIETGPADYGTTNHIGVFSNIARLLSFKDPQMARKLLEPVFDDLSWLHEYGNRQDFVGNFPLHSTLWIDPEWTLELSRDLAIQHEDDSIVKLATYSGIIEEAYFIARSLKRLQENHAEN